MVHADGAHTIAIRAVDEAGNRSRIASVVVESGEDDEPNDGGEDDRGCGC
jgi:hypothetical protein